MREIKFRGWHSIQKKMYSAETMAEDQLTLLPTGQFINVSGQSTKLSQIISNDEFIPLQFTGLHDKNGKEIYEGDIVQFQSILGVVEYTKDCAFEVMRTVNNPLNNSTIEEGEPLCSEYEVIGNIYENPELLEEER